MKLAGEVEIRVIDSRDGQIKQVIKKSNLITNFTLTNMLTSTGRYHGGLRISISTSTATPNISVSTLPNIIATGYVPSGVTSPTYTDTSNPPYGQIQNRIDFTGTDRVFNSVGLTNLSSSNNQNTSETAYAYLKLDTECVQGAFDFLDIFYRIQFFNTSGQGFTERALKDFSRRFFLDSSVPGWQMHYVFWNWATIPSLAYPYKELHAPHPLDRVSEQTSEYNFNAYRWGGINGELFPIPSHYKFKFAKTFGIENSSPDGDINGRIINLISQGYSYFQNCTYAWKLANSSSPFQNIFKHSSSATKPFFDSLALANGNGNLYTSGSWTNKLPEFYKYTITASGEVGTSTYKFSVRKHLGFFGNAYSERVVGCPFRNPNLPLFDKCHGWRDENNDVLRFSDTKIVQYDDTGITLLDIFDGSYQNWEATTTPALNATQIRQCATDGSKIYVGCRLTGLWIIDVAANTVVQQFTNPCYGVDVGRNAIAFAIVEGGLYRSSDWSTPLNFTYAGITDNNWSKAYFLKIDPEHPEDRLAIVMQPPIAANRRIVWWQAQPYQMTATTSYSAAVLENNPIMYLRLGETSGTTAVDSSGKGNTGSYFNCTLNTPSSLAGDSNTSVTLNGSTSRIGTTTQYSNPQVFSLAIRFKTSAAINQGLIGYSNFQDITVQSHDRQIYLDTNGKLNFRIFDGSVRLLTSTLSYNNNQWNSAVATFNNGAMNLYANGSLIASASVGNAQSYSGWWHVGYAPGVANSFSGSLDEAAIYDTALSPQAISDHHNLAQGNQLTVIPVPAINGAESSSIRRWAASLDVSDIGGYWACGAANSGGLTYDLPIVKLTYASAAISNFSNNYFPYWQFTHSVYGNDFFYKVAFYKDYLITINKIIDKNNTTINNYTRIDNNDRFAFWLHMGGGILLTGRFLRQLFTDNSYAYDNYGWNGTTWELNHPGSKATHADEQPLINGVNIRFQNGANSPHFVAGDYYTQGLCYGVWKDNVTQFYFEGSWYSKPAQFNYPVQTGLTVPAQPTNPEPPPTKHWRVKNLVSATGSDAQWIVRELAFRNKAGNVISLTGGVANASANTSTARLAFDGSTGTIWNGAGLRVVNGWLQYSFANPAVVYGLVINHLNNGSNIPPTSFALEYSLDEINWILAFNFQISGNADNTNYIFTGAYNTNYEVTLSAASDPDFVTIEVDSAELTKLTLNGQPLATTYFNNSIPPGPNEAVVFSEGKVNFNAVDAGKTISGTYAWIKD